MIEIFSAGKTKMNYIGVQLARHDGVKTRAEIEDRAITTRSSSTALFCIDSADRYKTIVEEQFGLESPYRFLIHKNRQSLLNGFFTRIAVTEIVFPYFIPNINARTNTIEVIYNGGAAATLTIPVQGFYSPPQLASTIEALLIPLTNPGATVTYTTTGQFLFNVGAGNTLILYPTTATKFSLFDLIGGEADWINPGGQILTSKVTRCRYTDFIDIVSPELTYNQDVKDGSSDPIVRDTLCRIYLEDETSPIVPVYQTAAPAGPVMPSSVAIPGTYPLTIYRKFPHPKQIQWNNTQPIGNLSFEVYDSRGELLTTNYAPMPDYKCPDWRMTLLVSEN